MRTDYYVCNIKWIVQSDGRQRIFCSRVNVSKCFRLFLIYISGFHFLDSLVVVIWSVVIFHRGAIYSNRERGV
ncbi:H3 lysine-4 specific,Histone-lysine N-methyltransferase [Trichinella spiralis]|uniref:H3 lysine-4 specific,Histone-lysine N-methyltransferase n=1 Tax=Trichinella spiralis TaxID=6334 RepID=A0ABR3K8R7_TRISP